MTALGWAALGFMLVVCAVLVWAVVQVDAEAKRPRPVEPPTTVDLDVLPVAMGLLRAWMRDYDGVPIGDMVAAREEVRRVMPALGQQLDRLALEWRRKADPAMCTREPHPWVAEPTAGVQRCPRCGAIEATA